MATARSPQRIRNVPATTDPSQRSPSTAITSSGGQAAIITWLSSLVALGAAVAAGVGLFWNGPSGPSTFTTIHGEMVDLYAHGLYRYDSLLIGAGYRGTDAATLFIGVPLLIAAVFWFRRGSMRGTLLLAGVLSYTLYVYASMALGASFNGLFLVYVALFSASLFALGLTIRSIDPDELSRRFSHRTPHRATGMFLLVSALLTTFIWLQPLLGSMLRGETPELLDRSTTMVTDALDLGIISPLLVVAGIMILRRNTLGYLIGIPLIGIMLVLAPSIVAATVSQNAAGVSFSPGEMIGPIAGFTTIGLLAILLMILLLRNVEDLPHK